MREKADRPFDPNKARMIVGGRVENVDFAAGPTRGEVGNNLRNLSGLLKGASPEDYDKIFNGVPLPMLQHFADISEQLTENMKRIIRERQS